MQLVERGGFLVSLQNAFGPVLDGEGHCVFVSGEAGIGKTTLVKSFCNSLPSACNVYTGICDTLFTPRPLAPLYDILLQLRQELPAPLDDLTDRTALFSRVFQLLSDQPRTSVLVFEDIHWADEATLDFIKFLARRINQLSCLFILTYRDDEIHSRHPLRNVLGQLSPDSFTRMQLTPLSKEAVQQMAAEKGFNGEEVFSISGGNPFYVNEILASYSPGIPDNIRDSVLSVYHRQDEPTRRIWELLSVSPSGIRIGWLQKIDGVSASTIDRSLEANILLIKNDWLVFKHELYRLTIEASLFPLTRIALNKEVLLFFREYFEQHGQIERIIHHAKNANDHELVVQYAPQAARQAAAIGAHIEAAKLYQSAIEYYTGHDPAMLIRFYEGYAYECYLTNRMKEAISYTEKALLLWQQKDDPEQAGNSLRFLSRLWWFAGDKQQAEVQGWKAIDVLQKRFPSRIQAMAYSNMSQLKMLSDESGDCLYWGQKAMDIARDLGDEEILAHALNNVGSVRMKDLAAHKQGLAELQQSLAIALKNDYHEHVARAYTNLVSKSLVMKRFSFVKKMLQAGLLYCEERGLDSWTAYMSSWKARLLLETGHWDEAVAISERLLKNEIQSPVNKIGALTVLGTIKFRRGEPDALPILEEARTIAFAAGELQRIIPVFCALLEYEWISGKVCIDDAMLSKAIAMMETSGSIFDHNDLSYWLRKVRKLELPVKNIYKAYVVDTASQAQQAAAWWNELGAPYMHVLALFDGNDDDKRKAIGLLTDIGAIAVYEKLKGEMRMLGIKSIPRGIRKATRANVAGLTARELDILQLLQEGLQNREIAGRLYISAKTVDNHISAVLFKLQVNSRVKAVHEGMRLGILK